MTQPDHVGRSPHLPASWHVALTRVRLSLGLLTQRQPWVFLTLDALLLLVVLIGALIGGGEPKDLYLLLVAGPTLLLGMPLLSDAIALERRAGTLDLALTSPGGRFYFERRVFAGVALLFVQAVVIVVVTWAVAAPSHRIPLAAALAHALLLCLFTGAVVLFWATRLDGTAAVAIASLATALVMKRWTLAVAVEYSWAVIPPLFVLFTAAVVAYLHARHRLDRPQLLLR